MINEVYLYAIVVIALILVFLIGFFLGGSRYRQKYREDLVLFQGVIDRWKNENEQLRNDRAREIAHTATTEWNNGYEAASEQFDKEMNYICQWLDEHDIPSGELRTLIENLKTKEWYEEE